jgi:hypothetical protein
MTDARRRANERIGAPHDDGHAKGQCNLLVCPEETQPTDTAALRAPSSGRVRRLLARSARRQVRRATEQVEAGLRAPAGSAESTIYFRAALATLGNLGAS